MDHGGTLEHLVEALAGLPLDVTEHLVDALQSSLHELGNLTHDDVVKLLTAAVTASAGAAAKHYLDSNHRELEAALLRGLAGG